MKKILLASLVSSVLIITSGCSTYSASRYSVSADNVVALRQLSGKTISVGAFSAAVPGQKEIMCRGVGPIKTPDGEPFSDFVRKAFMDELKIANIYASNAPVTLSGSLDSIEFSSTSGNWLISLTIKNTTGKSMKMTESYSYTTSFVGETACNQTAQAFMPAVQNLVGSIVKSAEFAQLVAQ
jgi:hypothetical protein